MPKLYDNLRESIICAAKDKLLTSGFDALTMRGIADTCGIAVGTVYNYFPSKEMLTAAVMLTDWLQLLEGMKRNCEKAATVREGLTAIYNGLIAYTNLYQTVWSGYTFSKNAKSELSKRHMLLIGQLSEVIIALFPRLGTQCSHDMAVFFAENVLTCAGNTELTFDALLAITEPIIESKTTIKE